MRVACGGIVAQTLETLVDLLPLNCWVVPTIHLNRQSSSIEGGPGHQCRQVGLL